LEAVPNTPSMGISHLALPMQTAIHERIDKSARVWAVGASANWDKTVVGGYTSALPKETQEVVKKIQVFAVALKADHEITVTASLQNRDEPAAKALERFLKNQRMELFKDLRIHQENTWVTLQGQTTTDKIRNLLDQGFSVQRK
jgi:hypothetical protein